MPDPASGGCWGSSEDDTRAADVARGLSMVATSSHRTSGSLSQLSPRASVSVCVRMLTALTEKAPTQKFYSLLARRPLSCSRGGGLIRASSCELHWGVFPSIERAANTDTCDPCKPPHQSSTSSIARRCHALSAQQSPLHLRLGAHRIATTSMRHRCCL